MHNASTTIPIKTIASFKKSVVTCFIRSTSFYPALMGSKTPTSKFSESKEVRWGINCPLKSDWFN
ncbi:hypothetical protein DN390_25705 [Bacillus sp. SH7-1]|nr:hypothetical protein COK35_06690 [Bacillus cereus]PGW24982.1 hypothetical protein COD88_20660 [Bacillus cereus]TXR92380.1 hypothetical protein DN390_25705 [Bacillus sp. SH7-1]